MMTNENSFKFYREAEIVAAAIISAAADGNPSKAYDLCECMSYVLDELEARRIERQRKRRERSAA